MHSVGVGNSVSAVFMLFSLKDQNSAINVSCYNSASSLGSNCTLKTSGMRGGLVWEEPKSFKCQLVNPGLILTFVEVSKRENEKLNPSSLPCSTDRLGGGIVLSPFVQPGAF